MKPSLNEYKVVVSNLKKNVTDDEIRSAFSSCGRIRSVKTSRDQTNGNECKGYCHIVFSSQDAMDTALASNLKIRIQNQTVKVRLPGESQSGTQLLDLKALAKESKLKN